MKSILTSLNAGVLIVLSSLYLASSSCAMFKKTENINLQNEARTTDQLIDDSQLEKTIEKTLKNTSVLFNKANINVLVSNGWILLVGEVQEEPMIAEAEAIAGKIGGVVEVHNHLKVDDNRSLLESAHDNWIKLKVRNHLGIDPKFPSQKITVHTEKGIVYLMGQISRKHVFRAVSEAKKVKGVQEIIPIFEIVE